MSLGGVFVREWHTKYGMTGASLQSLVLITPSHYDEMFYVIGRLFFWWSNQGLIFIHNKERSSWPPLVQWIADWQWRSEALGYIITAEPGYGCGRNTESSLLYNQPRQPNELHALFCVDKFSLCVQCCRLHDIIFLCCCCDFSATVTVVVWWFDPGGRCWYNIVTLADAHFSLSSPDHG